MTGRLAGLFLLLALLPWRTANAHPHVFIAWHVEPQMENGAVTAVKLHWRFDDLYSDLVLSTIDRDRDRKLSPAEIEALSKRTLANLEKVHFYASVTLDGQPWQPEKAESFSASVEGDYVIYVFTIKLAKPAKALAITSLDPEYYIEMTTDKRQATSGNGFACAAGRGEGMKTQMWGTLYPDTVTCNAR